MVLLYLFHQDMHGYDIFINGSYYGADMLQGNVSEDVIVWFPGTWSCGDHRDRPVQYEGFGIFAKRASGTPPKAEKLMDGAVWWVVEDARIWVRYQPAKIRDVCEIRRLTIEVGEVVE